MEFKDCYKILGVERGATQEEIKRAYLNSRENSTPTSKRGRPRNPSSRKWARPTKYLATPKSALPTTNSAKTGGQDSNSSRRLIGIQASRASGLTPLT